MNKSVYRKTLDVQKNGAQFTVNANQNEALSREIILSITDGGKPFEFGDTISATLYAKKPDGTTLYNYCTVDGNKVTYVFTQQTLTAVGDVKARLEIIADEQVLYSPEFIIQVNAVDDYSEAVESTNEYTALTETMAIAIEKISEMSGLIEDFDNIDVVVTQTETGATITITNIDGTTTTAEILNGADGQDGIDGQDGADGVSPTIAVTDITGGHRVTITDADGTHTFDVMDGEKGNKGDKGSTGYGIYPSDTAPTPVTGEVYSYILDGSETEARKRDYVLYGNELFYVLNYVNGTLRLDAPINLKGAKGDTGADGRTYTVGNTMQAPNDVLNVKDGGIDTAQLADGAVNIDKVSSKTSGKTFLHDLCKHTPLEIDGTEQNPTSLVNDIDTGNYIVTNGGYVADSNNHTIAIYNGTILHRGINYSVLITPDDVTRLYNADFTLDTRSLSSQISTNMLGNGAVTTGKIADEAVTYGKLAPAVQALFASVFRFKGKVATVSDLPATGNVVGDVWTVTADNSERAYIETNGQGEWINLGLDIDLSGYLSKAEAQSDYATKVYVNNAIGDINTALTTIVSGGGVNGNI